MAGGPERRFEVEARAFVVAAGGLESARLLLASNEQTPAGIGNEHDLVGRFYMTHPVAEVGPGGPRADRAKAADAGGFLLTRDSVYCRRILRISDEAQGEHDLLNLALALWYPEPGDPTHSDALLSTFALVRAGMARGARGLEVQGHPPPLRRDRGRARPRGQRGARAACRGQVRRDVGAPALALQAHPPLLHDEPGVGRRCGCASTPSSRPRPRTA